MSKPTKKPHPLPKPGKAKVRGALLAWRQELLAWRAKGSPAKRLPAAVVDAHIVLLAHAVDHLKL